MSVYNKLKRAVANVLVQRKIPLKLSRPIVTFTFDDVDNSALTTGAQLLKKYGYNGTYYISLGISYKNMPDNGCFDSNLLQGIVNDGNELACHTYSHIQLYKSSRKEIVKDLAKNQVEIDRIIPGYRFTNFSYPYGQQTIASKSIVVNNFKSGRSIKGSLNVGQVDLTNLKVTEVHEGTQLNDIFSVIEKAIRSKAWLIFYTHDVKENPSPYGCTPDFFEKIASYCKGRNLEVCTIQEALGIILKK